MWTTLGREQKAAFGLLIILGISGLILGSLYFKNRVQISLSPSLKGKQFSFNDENSPIVQQKSDTDYDGLSDYDELYFYGTSPYIEDTDSDGYLDKEEIDAGEDPNCVRGRLCGGEIIKQPNVNFEFLETIEDPGELPDPMEAAKNIKAPELRGLLKNAGLPDDVLSQISDNELEKLYEDTLQQTEKQMQE